MELRPEASLIICEMVCDEFIFVLAKNEFNDNGKRYQFLPIFLEMRASRMHLTELFVFETSIACPP
jgi:hypothetical protein